MMPWRALYIIVCSIVFAGIVHITSVFLIPKLGSKDAARQIAKFGPTEEFLLLDENDEIGISDRDPFFLMAVCKFDLSSQGLQVSAPVSPMFWTASVLDEFGRVTYSLSDRSAIRNQLQLLVLNPVQIADIRQSKPIETESAIVVEMETQKGFVLLRVLQPDESWKDEANGFIQSATCDAYQTRAPL